MEARTSFSCWEAKKRRGLWEEGSDMFEYQMRVISNKGERKVETEIRDKWE